MEEKISSGLKATFLVHAIVGFIFSLIYLLIPERLIQWINWPTQETEVYRLDGSRNLPIVGVGLCLFSIHKAR